MSADGLTGGDPLPETPRPETPEAVVQALYAVISGPPEQPRDWARFRDLCRPDALLAIATAAAAALSVSLAPSGPGSSRAAALVAGAVTLFFVWRVAAGVGLYWAASGAVGVVESLAVRRLARREDG